MSLPPLIAGLPARDAQGVDDCACCEGLDVVTPVALGNRPGLSGVAYRPGAYGQFRSSQLARLSAAEHPALRRLKSRETDDFSIALIDAWSCVCDVLSFYQERNANEAWLGTAGEQRSLVELGRLIGYRLDPGVAAATDLVFLLEDPPGAAPAKGRVPSPTAGVEAVAVPARSRVQSIPGPGETAQTFETVEAVSARVGWNALAPRQSRLRVPRNFDRGCWLQGVSTNLKVGDAVLILGSERLGRDKGTERWDFRKLTRVEADADADRTWIAFTHPLGSIDPPSLTAQSGHRIFALRARASLFGWNAPDPRVLAQSTRTLFDIAADNKDDWPFTLSGSEVVLDSVQDGWVAGGFAVLTRPDYAELYRIKRAVDDGQSKYAVSARATRLVLDTDENLSLFSGAAYRKVSAYGKSEELAFAETPIIEPVMGDVIELSGLADDLAAGRRLVVRGRRAQAVVDADGLKLAEGDEARALARGERVTLLAAPVPVSPGATAHQWRLRAAGGFVGSLTAPLKSLDFVSAEPETEIAAEAAVLAEVTLADPTHARLELEDALAGAYDRATTVVHANVAAATHGETTQEILGDGDAARPFQTFVLKQAPLTYVSAASETGSASTLEVRVDEVLWKEVPTLYGRGPRERVFETRTTDEGATVVQFGDGVWGARPPSGRNNIVATYRKGTGLAGSVGSGRLTTALDRPLGLKEVFNPLAASSGDDPETLDGARDNAPVTTLTLGRVVSLRNYEDFARGFAGVAKAKADWTWDGESRRILVTVAGPGGAAVDDAVFDTLVGALRSLGDPFVRIAVASYRPATFRLDLRVLVGADYQQDLVLADVEAALRQAYSFDRRGFAPAIAASEIIATVHSVAGVEAVDLNLFHRTTPPNAQAILHQRLLAEPARLSAGQLLAAEILTLDPVPLVLEAMS